MILIFDLDNTVCKNTLYTAEKVNYVVNLIRNLVKTQHAKLYVVTARRLTDFNDEYDLLSYNIPTKIVQLFTELNKFRNERWLYYNDHDNHCHIVSKDVLRQSGKYYHNLSYLMVKKLDKEMFYYGIQKMVQINEILSKYKKYPKLEVIFFDDASYNHHAWIYYKMFVNPYMRDLKFIGGKDKPVFT